MISVKLTQIGNSVGVALPKAVLERLRAAKGDSLFLVETPEGFMLTPYDPDLARQMEAAEAVMREDRDVLKALAK
ncbi:MAG: AbrB/MazE/SpoVT family DNA-binding domain-containing protein [Parvibaculum sp.]|nr:AbrB/MazE/SpoVT family DNA-binding domain-containing protein [Parvibaculum sp.]